MRSGDFYDIAEYLLDDLPPKKEEAAERTAVSRIYYAAFLYARDLLMNWGLGFGEASSKVHAQVCEGLRRAQTTDLRNVGESLAELHRERRRADYDTAKAEGFNIDTIKELYTDVVPGLRDSWIRLDDEDRRREKARIQDRITEIAKSRWV